MEIGVFRVYNPALKCLNIRGRHNYVPLYGITWRFFYGVECMRSNIVNKIMVCGHAFGCVVLFIPFRIEFILY